MQTGLRLLTDNTVNLSVPANNGQPYSVQISTNLVHWLTLCTNTAVNGSVQYMDPNETSAPNQFYRVVPVTAPAN
jgi:hypothetical protein